MSAARGIRVPACVALLAAAALLAGALAAPATPEAEPLKPRPPAADGSTPMDEPLRLLTRARQAFAAVRDYSCDFIRRERLRGQMQPDQFMRMKVRTEPFAVHLR